MFYGHANKAQVLLLLYYFTETIFCRLLLRMARMEMDCNLKKLG